MTPLNKEAMMVLADKLTSMAETGRDWRCHVVINGFHAQVLDEAAACLRALSSQVKS